MGGQLHIRLMGGFAVEANGVAVPEAAWRLRKAKAVVKLVALAGEHRIHRERACELLWPDRDPAAAANNLHQALYHARRAIDTLGDGAGHVLELRDDALTLPETVEVDVDVFEHTIGAALREGTSEALRAALALPHAELLPEDRYEQWTHARREALDELRLSALTTLAELLVSAGDPDEAIRALQQALVIEPLHEAAHRVLMRAYSAAGRRQRALEQFQQLRQALRREYADEPDLETRRLYRELLAAGHAEPARPEPEPAPDTAPRSRETRANPNNLPVQLTSFVGRERELADLARVLARHRLVTITGPGGCGKTRLAVEAAAAQLARHEAGVWLVDLAPLGDPALIPEAVALAMRLQLPRTLPAEDGLAAALADRHMLLVLDNCEHLVDGCAQLVDRLLRACPALAVLATSREPLHAPGEIAWRVPSLSVPDPDALPPVAALAGFEAIRLFCARAEAVRPDFALTEDNAADVAQLCFRLDGIPLAIELAAARSRLLTPGQTVERLGRSLDVLRGGARTALDRQQTLEATVRWSEALLSEEERTLFRRLSVFAGTFSLDAAELVCSDAGLPAGEILDLLQRLLDKSLVLAEEADAAIRYRMLETFRQYAMRLLIEVGEDGAFEHCHRVWCRALAARTAPTTPFAERRAALRAASTELANVRVALARGLAHAPAEALELAADLQRLWLDWGHLVEGARWLRLALDAAPERTPLRARALHALGAVEYRLAVHIGDWPTWDEAIDILREHDDAHALGWALHVRAMIDQTIGRFDVLRELNREALEIAERVGDATFAGSCHHLDAQLAFALSAADASEAALERTLECLRSAPDDAEPWFYVIYLPALSPLREGVDGRLRMYHEDTLMFFQRCGPRGGEAYAELLRAANARERGDHEAARAPLDRAVARFRELGDLEGLAIALSAQGSHARSRREFDQAVEWYEESVAVRRELGDQRQYHVALGALGLAQAYGGDYEGGRRLMDDARETFERAQDLPALMGQWMNLGALMLDRGELEAANETLEQARLRSRELSRRTERWWVWINLELAEIAGRLGEAHRERELIEQALGDFRRYGDEHMVRECEELLAAPLSAG